MIPDLVDVNTPEGNSYRWFTLEPEAPFLALEEAGEDEVGQLSNSLEYEGREMGGWEDMMDLGWENKAKWALVNGVAPSQPFLYRFGEPRYSRSYDGECDVDYDVEFIRVLPWSMAQIIKAWADFLADSQAYEEYRAECEARFKANRLVRPDRMYISTGIYFASGQSSWDEMTMPSGIRYYLNSDYQLEPNLWDHLRGRHPHRLNHTSFLATGDDDRGDHEKALSAMVRDALEKIPDLTEEQVRKLPIRRGM